MEPVLTAVDGPDTELGQVLAVLRASGVEDPAVMPLSAGDRVLLGIVERETGAPMELTVTCDACETVNSVVLAAASMPAAIARDAVCGWGGGVREPTYGDLLGLPTEATDAVNELVRRCTVGAPARPPTAADLDRVDDALTGPVVLVCAGCGAVTEAPVDVQRAALHRLTQMAEEVDAEVHLLAHAYHWDLATIEGLVPQRRRRLARLVADRR